MVEFELNQRDVSTGHARSRESRKGLTLRGLRGATLSLEPVCNQHDSKHETSQVRLARFLMLALTRMCQIDSCNVHAIAVKRLFSHRWAALDKFFHREHNLRAQQADLAGHDCQTKHSPPFWPQLVILVYLYTSAKFSLSAYYLTKRHQLLLQFETLTSLARGEQPLQRTYSRQTHVPTVLSEELLNSPLRNELELVYNVSMSLERRLKLIGNPYSEAGVFAACGYLILVILTFILYMMPQLYHNYRRSISFQLISVLLEGPSGREQCEKLIGHELAYLENSSRNFVILKQQLVEETLDELQLKIGLCFTANPPRLPGPNVFERDWSGRITLEQSIDRATLFEREQTIEHLNWLHRSERLIPINRLPDREAKLIRDFNGIVLGNTLYSLIFDILILVGLPWLAGVKLRLELADICSLADLFALTAINVLSANLYLGLIVAHCANQTEYIVKMSEMIGTSIERGKREFMEFSEDYERVALTGGKPSTRAQRRIQMIVGVGKLNRSFLETISKYRIFVTEMRNMGHSWHMVIVSAMILIIVIPLLIRCYGPYSIENSRPVGLICSLSFVVYADTMLLPLCKIHLVGQGLYKRMCSLLAHTIEINSISARLINRHVYAESAQTLLRKELSHPHEILEQFVAKGFGLRATFSNMVSVHFYYVALIISLFFEQESWQRLLGDRLRDPLNLI